MRRWAASLRPSGFRPVDERPAKLELLRRYCGAVGTDPDTIIAKSRADREAKNDYLRQLVRWAKELPGGPRAQHDAEATVRGFFMKNGFRVMTKPYSDVYRRTTP